MKSGDAASHEPLDVVTHEDGFDLATRVIHDGESRAASATPIYQANTVDGIYIRMRNPTVEALEEKMRSLEGGAFAIAMGSGMAAISHTLFGLLKPGDRLIVHRSVFVGVQSLLNDFVSKFGIRVAQIDLNSSRAIDEALSEPAQLVYFETISNPGLEVVDAPAVIARARRARVPVAVDNTLLTPCLFKPLDCGADIVIHSATKYLSGHGDVLAGIVTVKDEALGKQLHMCRRLLGGLLSPLGAFLVMRGLKTLPLRMARHCENAQHVAERLVRHPLVKQVRFPGLSSTSDHERARSFLTGFGGLVSFDTCESVRWDRFASLLKLCAVGMSFGDPATRLQREGSIRLAVGLEDPDDIVRDLDRALDGSVGARGCA